MKFLLHLLLTIVLNALALWICARYIPGFHLSGTAQDILMLGAILWLLNVFIKPILTFLLGPLIFLTLGILMLAINAGILFLLDILSPHLSIDGIAALLWSTLIIGAFNIFSAHFLKNS